MRQAHKFYIAAISTFMLASIGGNALAVQPTHFTFTPRFQDPDPGKRIWAMQGSQYVETLPSGRRNTFRVKKPGTVHGQAGTIIQKIEEPNFYVFIADTDAPRKELWWWRDKGPWNFMGNMQDVMPVRID